MRRLPLVLAVLIASSPGAAAAPPDDPPADAEAPRARRLEQVQVTATRRAESTLDVPVATTVVDRDEIRAQAPQTVMDALHGEVGTFVQSTTPGQAVVIVRGLKGSEVLHLVDGFRLNNAIFRNAPNQYVALVDAQMLERVEVVRGPMSALYGGDAMGGVVQMLTHDPRFDGRDWQFEGGVRGLYATADDARVTRAEGAAGHEALVVSGGATYQDVRNLRVGGGDTLRFTAFTARAADLKLVALPADGHELMVSAQKLEQPKTPRFDELVPGFGQTRPTSSVFFFEPQQRAFYHARYRFDADAGWLDGVEVHAGRQRIRDDRRTREFGSANEERERNRVDTDGASVQATTQAGRHYLTYGVEYYRDEVDSFRERRNVDTGAISARPSRFPDGSLMRQLGVYVTDDVLVGDRLDVNGGVRYSRVRTDLPAAAGGLGVALDDDDVSANIGAAYALNDATKLVANVGRGFRAPNVFDVGTFGSRPGNRFNRPNPDLRPETVVTVDAGFKFAGQRAEGELIAFHSDYRDKLTSVLTGETTPSGQLVVQTRNATELELWGVEAGTKLRWTDDVLAYATATWTRGTERLAGDAYPADRVPPLFGKAGVRWYASDALTLEGYVLYATAQDRLSPRDAVDPRIDPRGTAGWTTLNARVAYRVDDRLDVGLRLENLGDKRYREHGTGLDEPGFNAIVTVDWRF
jgi:outer membrane receptor protein involved in Fe transport